MTNTTRQMLRALLESAAANPTARNHLRHRAQYDGPPLARMLELATPAVAEDTIDCIVARGHRGDVVRAIEGLAAHQRAASGAYDLMPRQRTLAVADHADAVASRLRREWFAEEGATP